MIAMKAISMAAMLMARTAPWPAPRAAASIMLAAVRSILRVTFPAVFGVSVSGMIILAINKEAGAAIRLAAIRYSALIPRLMYPPRIAPETVAIPPVIKAMSSE